MTVSTPKQPLEVVKQCASALRSEGPCEIVYATAEFQPFSSQFKPDLVFRPTRGPLATQTVFFEFTPNIRFRDGEPLGRFFQERKDFAEQYIERPIDRYVAFVNVNIDDFSREIMKRSRIDICRYTNDHDEVIKIIKNLGII